MYLQKGPASVLVVIPVESGIQTIHNNNANILTPKGKTSPVLFAQYIVLAPGGKSHG